jgi:hypothetical protein
MSGCIRLVNVMSDKVSLCEVRSVYFRIDQVYQGMTCWVLLVQVRSGYDSLFHIISS